MSGRQSVWANGWNCHLVNKWVSGIIIDWAIVRFGVEEICKVCDFVNGILCEMVIWYLGDQVIALNADCTNWWSSEIVFKYVDYFKLGLFTDSVTERIVLWVTLLLHYWATEWFIDWVAGWLADRSVYRRKQNVLLLLLLTFLSFSFNFQVRLLYLRSCVC